MKAVHRPGDSVYRIGGEEFAVLLPDTSLSGAETLATDILEQIRALDFDHKHGIDGKVTASMGVATGNAVTDTCSADLMKSADNLLYQAKANGRNCVAARPAQIPPSIAGAPSWASTISAATTFADAETNRMNSES